MNKSPFDDLIRDIERERDRMANSVDRSLLHRTNAAVCDALNVILERLYDDRRSWIQQHKEAS